MSAMAAGAGGEEVQVAGSSALYNKLGLTKSEMVRFQQNFKATLYYL